MLRIDMMDNGKIFQQNRFILMVTENNVQIYDENLETMNYLCPHRSSLSFFTHIFHIQTMLPEKNVFVFMNLFIFLHPLWAITVHYIAIEHSVADLHEYIVLIRITQFIMY